MSVRGRVYLVVLDEEESTGKTTLNIILWLNNQIHIIFTYASHQAKVLLRCNLSIRIYPKFTSSTPVMSALLDVMDLPQYWQPARL